MRSRVLASLVVCLSFTLTSCRQPRVEEVGAGYGIPAQLFVKQTQGMGYSAVEGEIVDVTCDYVRVNTAGEGGKKGERLLYSNDAVRRINLGGTPNNPRWKSSDGEARYRQWQTAVDSCWNRDKSRFVVAFQSAPLVGSYLSWLDKLPPGFDTFMAIVILAIFLFYGGFKSYEFLMVSSRASALSREKLSKEVRKLGYEIEALKKTLGAGAPEPLSQPTVAETLPVFGLSIERLHIKDFLKYKVLRVPTEIDITHRRNKAREEWQEYRKKRSKRALYVRYGLRLTVNWFLTGFVAVFCVTYGIEAFIFPFMYMPEFGATGIWVGLTALLFAVFLGSLWLRLNIRRRILRETYREVVR